LRREDAELVDDVRRQEHVDAVLVGLVALDDEIGLELVDPFDEAGVFPVAEQGDQLGADDLGGDDGLARAEIRPVVGELVAGEGILFFGKRRFDFWNLAGRKPESKNNTSSDIRPEQPLAGQALPR
jgi:hypothetical protein